MHTIRISGGALGRFFGQDHWSDPEAMQERIDQLSSWMMVLGTVRLVCAVGDYATMYLEVSRGYFTWRLVGRFLQDNPPAVVLGFAWPLLLGIILQRTGREIFLKAAAITFLVMSSGGIIALVAGLTLRSDWQIFFGSFHVPRGMLIAPRPASVTRAVLGSVQLLLELGTAGWAWLLWRQARAYQVAGSSDPATGTTRSLLQGRLAIYLSVAFLFLNVRMPVWSAYLEVLNRSRFVRELILENDNRRHISYRDTIVDSPAARRALELDALLSSALRHAASGQFAEARDAYLRIISLAQPSDPDLLPQPRRDFHLARAFNNLAWLLATCPDPQFRDPGLALSNAERAVELAQEEGTYWNTLGVCRYRAGLWPQAITALDRSIELRDPGDGYDWYFLAMARARQGRKADAMQWFEKAVKWHAANESGVEELYRFRVEAAELLGQPRPPALDPAPRAFVPDHPDFAASSVNHRFHNKKITDAQEGATAGIGHERRR
jgi:tetratricopeptide (TPR) repeat protein